MPTVYVYSSPVIEYESVGGEGLLLFFQFTIESLTSFNVFIGNNLTEWVFHTFPPLILCKQEEYERKREREEKKITMMTIWYACT